MTAYWPVEEHHDDEWPDAETRAIMREILDEREQLFTGTYLSGAWLSQYRNASRTKSDDLRASYEARKDKPKKASKDIARRQPPANATEAELALWHAADAERWKRYEQMLESQKSEYEYLVTQRFTWDGGGVAKRWVEPFVEEGLRSANIEAVARFVQMVPRRGEVEAGYRKDVVFRRRSKLLGLTLPYVRANTKVIGCFRIDLDRLIPDIDYLKQRLRDLLPILPDLVVYDRDCGNAVNRPHLWFFLPINSCVWNDPTDPRWREAPMRLLRSVMAAIVDRLAPLGADPGGLTNPFHGKNPASPLWRIRVLNDRPNLDLTAWRRALGLGRTDAKADERRTRRHAAVVSGLAPDVSNSIFTVARLWSHEIMRGLHAEGGTHYAALLADREALERALQYELSERLLESQFAREPRAAHVVRAVARYQARRWDPERVGALRTQAGVMGELAGTPRERMAVGGRYAAQRKRENSQHRVVSAALELHSEGVAITQKALAQRSGVHRSTAAAHFQAAMAAIAEACRFQAVDKKLPYEGAPRATAVDDATTSGIDAPSSLLPMDATVRPASLTRDAAHACSSPLIVGAVTDAIRRPSCGPSHRGMASTPRRSPHGPALRVEDLDAGAVAYLHASGWGASSYALEVKRTKWLAFMAETAAASAPHVRE